MKKIEIIIMSAFAALYMFPLSCQPAPDAECQNDSVEIEEQENPSLPNLTPDADWFICFDKETIVSDDGKGGKWILTAKEDDDLKGCFLAGVSVSPNNGKGNYYYDDADGRVTEYENELFGIRQLSAMSFEIEIFEFPATGIEQYDVTVKFYPEDRSSKYIFGDVFLTIK